MLSSSVAILVISQSLISPTMYTPLDRSAPSSILILNVTLTFEGGPAGWHVPHLKEYSVSSCPMTYGLTASLVPLHSAGTGSRASQLLSFMKK